MLTSTGRLFVAAAILLPLAGGLLDYPELVTLGIIALVVVVIAVLHLVARSSVTLRRRIEPVRVGEGDPSFGHLTATNSGQRRSAPLVADDSFGDSSIPVSIPSLGRGESSDLVYELPTERRGVFNVGPLEIGFSDPLGLVKAVQRYGVVHRLIVHPRIYDLASVPTGDARELEGPAASSAPRGGVVFHSLREYVPGDDLRLVHWKSTARTGTLMVRHNVVSTDPRIMVVVDTSSEPYADRTSFDDAMRAAASLVSSAVEQHHPTELRTTAGEGVAISPRGASLGEALDLLAACEPDDRHGGLEELPRIDVGDKGVSLCVITGSASNEQLRPVGLVRTRFQLITLIRIGMRRETADRLGGVLCIEATDIEDLAQVWNARFQR